MTSLKRPDKSSMESMKVEAADLVNHLLDAIPREAKRKHSLKFWDWAQKALKTGADKGTTFDRMVSEMVRQLPIKGALPKKSDRSIYSMREKYSATGHYRYFRNICRKNAEMIIVRARVQRDQRKVNPGLDPDASLSNLPQLHSTGDDE